jgi:hypothetical protein
VGGGWVLIEEFLGTIDGADHHCLELLLKTGRVHRVVSWETLDE